MACIHTCKNTHNKYFTIHKRIIYKHAKIIHNSINKHTHTLKIDLKIIHNCRKSYAKRAHTYETHTKIKKQIYKHMPNNREYQKTNDNHIPACKHKRKSTHNNKTIIQTHANTSENQTTHKSYTNMQTHKNIIQNH